MIKSGAAKLIFMVLRTKQVELRVLKIEKNAQSYNFVYFVRFYLQFIDFICNIDKLKQNDMFFI